MKDSFKENFEDLKDMILTQTRKDKCKIAIIAAITAITVIAVAGLVIYFVKGSGCNCNDDFCEFEDDFEDEEDFEEE